MKTAQNLVLLAADSTIGEMMCLTEILDTLMAQKKISDRVVLAWILIALNRDDLTFISLPSKVNLLLFCFFEMRSGTFRSVQRCRFLRFVRRIAQN